MSDFVAARARKWCPGHGNRKFGPGMCECDRIAAAIREALEEAEKRLLSKPAGDKAWWVASDAVAALRGGTDA